MNLAQLNTNFGSISKEFPKELEGQWIAVLDGKIIAHNQSFKTLFLEVRKISSDKKVLFHRVPEKEIIIV